MNLFPIFPGDVPTVTGPASRDDRVVGPLSQALHAHVHDAPPQPHVKKPIRRLSTPALRCIATRFRVPQIGRSMLLVSASLHTENNAYLRKRRVSTRRLFACTLSKNSRVKAQYTNKPAWKSPRTNMTSVRMAKQFILGDHVR